MSSSSNFKKMLENIKASAAEKLKKINTEGEGSLKGFIMNGMAQA